MKILNTFLTAVVFSLILISTASHANASDKVLLILDCSTGMNREVAGEKLIYSMAREVVSFVSRMDSSTEVGMIVFGHTSKRCDDAELIAPFARSNAEKIRTELSKISPVGNRGLINAIEKGLNSFEDSAFASIYVFTSGIDQCGDRYYYLQDSLDKQRSNYQFTIIGIDVDSRDSDNLNDMASFLNGHYQSVANAQKLDSILRETVETSLGNVSVSIKGMDHDTGSITLRIYDDQGRIVDTSRITGFYSTNLNTGIYDFEIITDGRAIWNRDIFIERDRKTNLVFDLQAALGDLKIEIYDMQYQPMKGNITVYDSLDNPVYEGKNLSEYLVSLPEGFYSAEVQVGSEIETFCYIEILSDTVTSYPTVINLLTGNAEIIINNYDGYPVHASVTIEDEFGNIVGEIDYTSNYRITLPPGFYSVIAVTGTGYQQSTDFYLPEGDNISVDMILDVPLGSIFLMLRTPGGHDVWGRIKVYDERGRLIPHFQFESIEEAEFTFDVPQGTYRIQAEVEGVIRTADGVQVREGRETAVEIVFPEELG